MSDCVFCKIVAKEIQAREVYRDESVVAFHDLDPKAPVHILVIPTRHIATVNDLGESEAGLLGAIWARIPALAREAGIAEVGYRVVVNCLAPAGQSVFHLHFHLLGGRPMGWPPG